VDAGPNTSLRWSAAIGEAVERQIGRAASGACSGVVTIGANTSLSGRVQRREPVLERCAAAACGSPNHNTDCRRGEQGEPDIENLRVNL